MKCKYCESTEFYKETRGPHLGVFCLQCKGWQQWEKHTENTKTAEDYRREYYEKMRWKYHERT